MCTDVRVWLRPTRYCTRLARGQVEMLAGRETEAQRAAGPLEFTRRNDQIIRACDSRLYVTI